MPNISVRLPGVRQNISRPVAIAVVQQIQKWTNLKDCEIYFPNDSEKMPSPNATIDKGEDGFARTDNIRANYIRVTEKLDIDTLWATYFNDREYTPVFRDPALGFTISPIYAKQNVEVAFEYVSPSETETEQWLADMRMHISRLRETLLHTVQYRYDLNKGVMRILRTIYDLREKNAPYNDTFEQYIQRYASPRLTRVGDIIGKDSVLAVAESQTEIYGIFDFSGLPEKPERNDSNGFWRVAFTYQFNYDQVIGMNVRYPMIVHNTPLPYEMVAFTTKPVRPVENIIDQSRSQRAFSDFRADRAMDRVRSQDEILRVPMFDDWYPENAWSGTGTVLHALSAVEPDNLRYLLDLQDLESVVFDPDVLEFILRSEWPYLTRPYHSVFNVSVYRNKSLMGRKEVMVDHGLKVFLTSDADLRQQYRVRLGVVTDIDLLTNDAVARLRRYPKALVKVVQSMNHVIHEWVDFSNLGRKTSVSPCEFNYLYRVLTGKESWPAYEGDPGWITDRDFLTNVRCLTPQFLNRVRTCYRNQRTVMITGVIARPKE